MGNVLDKVNEVVEKEKKSRAELTSEAMIEEVIKCMAKAEEIGKVLEIVPDGVTDNHAKIEIGVNYFSIFRAGWSNLLVLDFRRTSDTAKQQLHEIFAGGLNQLWQKGDPMIKEVKKIWEDITLAGDNISVKIVK